MNDTKRTSLEDKWEAELTDAADGVNAADPADEGAAAEDEGVTALRDEISTLQDRVLRQQAEMANYRRRTERDRLQRTGAVRAEVLQTLLPILDDFELAVAAETDDLAGYRQGVELILSALRNNLESLGAERIEPLGEPFDPHVHEAVDQVPSADAEPGHVVAVYKAGYRLGERLVRPAMVGVARAPQAGEVPAEDTTDGVEA